MKKTPENEETAKGEHVVLKRVPGWIDADTLELNEKAETVASIFKMYLHGKGASAIARELNDHKVPTLSDKEQWAQSVVYRLLSNPQVIGERNVKGPIIKNFFPPVVSADTFLKVQTKLADNRGKHTTGTGYRKGNALNLFSGVAFCRCGKLIKVTENETGAKYITCYGGCDDPSMRYEPVEQSFSHTLHNNPRELLADGEDGPKLQLDQLRRRLVGIEKEIGNITAFVLKGKATHALVDKQRQLETEVANIHKEIEMESAKTVSRRDERQKLQDIVHNISKLPTDTAFRRHVQGWIRANVERMVIDRSKRRIDVYLKNGKHGYTEFDMKDWNRWGGASPKLSGGLEVLYKGISGW